MNQSHSQFPNKSQRLMVYSLHLNTQILLRFTIYNTSEWIPNYVSMIRDPPQFFFSLYFQRMWWKYQNWNEKCQYVINLQWKLAIHSTIHCRWWNKIGIYSTSLIEIVTLIFFEHITNYCDDMKFIINNNFEFYASSCSKFHERVCSWIDNWTTIEAAIIKRLPFQLA